MEDYRMFVCLQGVSGGLKDVCVCLQDVSGGL